VPVLDIPAPITLRGTSYSSGFELLKKDSTVATDIFGSREVKRRKEVPPRLFLQLEDGLQDVEIRTARASSYLGETEL